MDWIYWIIILLTSSGSVLSWALKLRWSKQHTEASNQIMKAKDEVIRSKDSQIETLERHISTIESLNPKKLQEWYLALQAMSVEYTKKIEQQLADAKTKIIEMETQGSMRSDEINRIRQPYEALKADYKELKDLQEKGIPNPAILIRSVSSSQKLADSTNSEALAIKLLSTDNWQSILSNLSVDDDYKQKL